MGYGVERGPNKRRIKPPANPVYLDYVDGESSSDSDFCIDDHCINSGSDSDGASHSTYSDGDDQEEVNIEDKEDKIGCNDNVPPNETNVVTNNQDYSEKMNIREIVNTIHICSICMGDASDDENELIDCNACGLSVHKNCFGVHDSGSVSSPVSVGSMEPWFCEACIAGIENPSCELCPNLGGIFKETEYGKWVHFVCALYIGSITFGEVTSLSNVMLFVNTKHLWCAKSCTLCEDSRFIRTGVTIACDAGMCRSNFHVTCAQREGSLSDATSSETDQSDPFYAHCKLHVDKLVAKNRKINWQSLQLKTKQMQMLRIQQASEKSVTWQHHQQRLKKLQSKYYKMKQISKPESMLKSKVPRPITSSASVCQVADLMGVNMASQEAIKGQIKALRDIPKKWHIPLAFSLEFVSYFKDRNLRLNDLKNQSKTYTDENNKLREEQIKVQEKCNEVSIENESLKKRHLEIQNVIRAYHRVLGIGNPNANIPNIDEIVKGCKKEDNF